MEEYKVSFLKILGFIIRYRLDCLFGHESNSPVFCHLVQRGNISEVMTQGITSGSMLKPARAVLTPSVGLVIALVSIALYLSLTTGF